MWPVERMATSLPAMDAYFRALDEFVRGHVGLDVATVVAAFERSDTCPVFAEYVLYPLPVRVAVASRRICLHM